MRHEFGCWIVNFALMLKVGVGIESSLRQEAAESIQVLKLPTKAPILSSSSIPALAACGGKKRLRHITSHTIKSTDLQVRQAGTLEGCTFCCR